MKRFLIFAFFLYSSAIFGQIPNSIVPWEFPMTYNPSGIGIFEDESISISLVSGNELNNQYINLIPVGSNPIFPGISSFQASNYFNSEDNIQNLFLLNYQKTHQFKKKHRLSAGLNLNKYIQYNSSLREQFDVNTNFSFHFYQRKSVLKEKYFSFGFQIGLAFFRPNIQYANNYFTENDRTIDSSRSEFLRDLKSTGVQQGIGLSYTVHKQNDLLFSLGFFYKVLDRGQSNLDNSLAAGNGLSYYSVIVPKFSLNFNLQQTFKKKYVFEMHLILGHDSIAGGGIGFKLKRSALLKFLIGRDFGSSDYLVSDFLQISYQINQVRLSLAFNKNSQGMDLRKSQIAVKYLLSKKTAHSLLSFYN